MQNNSLENHTIIPQQIKKAPVQKLPEHIP